MKRQDIIVLVTIGIFAFSMSYVLSGIFINPKKKAAEVPVVDEISSSFANVKNDPNYNNFLNENALDPTQPIQIGTPDSPNDKPFNASQ